MIKFVLSTVILYFEIRNQNYLTDDDNQGDQIQVPQNNGDEVDKQQGQATPSTEDGDENEAATNETRVTTRSGRVSPPPAKLTLVQQQLFTHAHHTREEYYFESARVIAMTMCRMNDIALRYPTSDRACQFVQSYGLMKGLKKFGNKGRQAAYKEMKQLHDRVVFKPIRMSKLTEKERRRAMESLIF